jgi:hypothetical protein
VIKPVDRPHDPSSSSTPQSWFFSWRFRLIRDERWNDAPVRLYCLAR